MSQEVKNDQKKPHKSLAILNCVVDRLYDGALLDEQRMEDFLKQIPAALGNPDMEVPRSDDTVFSSKSQLQSAAVEALTMRGEFNSAATAINDVFGVHKIAPGGSLANTEAALASSFMDGNPIVESTILTVLDEGESGDIFKNSYPDGVVLEDEVHGECLTVHVVPYDGGRSQFPTYSDTKPSNTSLSVPIMRHVQSGTYDSVKFEGFMADNPSFENDTQTLLTAISAANMQREMMGQKPTRLIITAGAQHVCNNPAFRDFVKQASEITDVSIHANTGEFRRLLDNDNQWRDTAEADFRAQNLEGRELEAAKKASDSYRAAKVAANYESVEKAMSEWGADTKFDLEFVVTDGGNTGFVINNDNYIEFEPAPLDPSTIVNKVGAGDAFMAFYRMARDVFGLSQEESMTAGGIGATHTLQQEEARTKFDRPVLGYSGPVALLAEKGIIEPTDLNRRIQEFPYPSSSPLLD